MTIVKWNFEQEVN